MKGRIFPVRLQSSRVMRLAVVAALTGQTLITAPLLAQDATKAAVKTASRVAADAKRRAAKARVRVNRTVPPVTAPRLEVAFGAEVTTAELRKVRLFTELLTPTREPSADENRALARVLETLAMGTVGSDDYVRHLDRYFTDHPGSPWRASLATNAAAFYAKAGYFSRAAALWDQAWELTRDSNEPPVRAIADYTLGVSMAQMAMFGQVQRMQQRLEEVGKRDVRGSAAAKVAAAREAYFVLTTHHEMAMYSGPEALKMYLTVAPTVAANTTLEGAVRTISAYHAPMMGTTLRELRDLAGSAGLTLDMIKVAALGEIPVPSVVHLRSQHFAAIVARQNGDVVLRDPSLGGTIKVSEAALRDEMTSHFLIAPTLAKDAAWQEVADAEADTVTGHCVAGGPFDNERGDPTVGGGGPGGGGGSPPDEPSSTGSGAWGAGGQPPDPNDGQGCFGMPSYSFQPAKASLMLSDAPLGCAPPVGPAVVLRLIYDHREARHPQTPAYGHVGPRWSLEWLSYVTDNPYCVVGPCPPASVLLRGSGIEAYPSPPATHPISRAQLVKLADDPPRYERRLADGTVEVFTLPDRAASQYNRRIFLTELIDPQGHSLTFTYDSSFRLIAVTDAIDQVTTLEYLDAADPLRLTRVTDPFGRVATLTYDGSGHLETITDVASLASRFSYGTSDFIVSMTTPYGTTTFQHEPDPTQKTFFRRIEATDPTGATERLEFHWTHAQLAATESSSVVPTGFSASNDSLNYYNSLYWDKVAMAQAPGALTSATLVNWMLKGEEGDTHAPSRNLPHSIKRPLENRVWYRYQDQASGSHHSHGTGRAPALIGRVLDGGVSQVTQASYTSSGLLASYTDPLGRQTSYTYASNGIDLVEVRRVVSGGTELLRSYGNYASHRPGTITDAASETTTITYNSAMQPLTVTNALSQTTTYAYESGTGYLLSVTGPVSGSTTTFSYDGYGRLDSVTGPDGYELVAAYDALNRLTEIAFPDDTSFTNTYTRLDLSLQTDRLGRVTRHFHDGFGRLTATRDAAGHTVSLVWSGGTLEALIDGKGQRTRWERDVQGRVTREIRADSATDTTYTYDVAGRLKTVTDPEDQVTTYTYNVDDTVQSVAFTNANIATPTISYSYDQYYPRALTMTDGVGTTTFSYKAVGTAGALSLASVDGPYNSDTITYTYDDLGRISSRMLNGTGTEITYDTLGRISDLEFPIGTFSYTFDGHTARVASVTYPNNQTTTYSYFGNTGDRRLQTLHHKNPSAATLSKFDYSYDAVGNILTWRQERAGATTQRYTFTHDGVDQLVSAVLTDTNTTPTILKRQAWAYDKVGNRTIDQTDDAVFTTAHNNLNQSSSRGPGGAIMMAGTVNEPATVTIDGVASTVDSSNNFRGTANLGPGTTTVTVKAKDPSGNESTQQYEIEASGSTTNYTYDANGNLVSDGTKSYFWNALNQLVEVKQSSTTLATFVYDGAGRRVEKSSSGLTHTYIYDAEDIVEERLGGSSSGGVRYFHGPGIDEPLARKTSTDVVTYYLADHLGSIVQETDASSVVTLEREYDPWGVLLGGSSTGGYAFTGREWDVEVGLSYHRARYYAPTTGRFINEDPIGLAGGLNRFTYGSSNSLTRVDPFGEDWWSTTTSFLTGFVGGAATTIALSFAVASGGAVGAGLAVTAVGVGAYQATISLQRAALGVDPYTGQPLDAEARVDEAAGLLGGLLGAGRAMNPGRELTIGGARIAPLGNRTGNPLGELPHYHRARPDPSRPGHSLQDQGMRRHRPWEGRPTDKSLSCRF